MSVSLSRLCIGSAFLSALLSMFCTTCIALVLPLLRQYCVCATLHFLSPSERHVVPVWLYLVTSSFIVASVCSPSCSLLPFLHVHHTLTFFFFYSIHLLQASTVPCSFFFYSSSCFFFFVLFFLLTGTPRVKFAPFVRWCSQVTHTDALNR